MEMEADRMRNLRLTEEDVATERQVILEERNQRTDSDPGALFAEQMQAAQYLNHPYGIPIIGWRHEMEALSREDALDFYRTLLRAEQRHPGRRGRRDPRRGHGAGRKALRPACADRRTCRRACARTNRRNWPSAGWRWPMRACRSPMSSRSYLAPERDPGDAEGGRGADGAGRTAGRQRHDLGSGPRAAVRHARWRSMPRPSTTAPRSTSGTFGLVVVPVARRDAWTRPRPRWTR